MPTNANKTTGEAMEKAGEVPFLSQIEGIARAMFNVSEDDVRLLKNIFDSNGKIKLYHPVVQSALLSLIKDKANEELKAQEEREAKKKEEAKKNRD